MVGLPVAAGVQPVAGDLPRRCGDGGGRAQVRPGGLAAQPPGVVSRRDEQQRRGVGPDPVEAEQPGGTGGDQGDDELVEALELAVQEHRAPSQLAQRDPGGITGDVAGAGPQRRDPGHQGGRGVGGEPGPQIIGSGQDQGPGLVDRPGAFSCGAALGDHQRADRLDRAVPALRRAVSLGLIPPLTDTQEANAWFNPPGHVSAHAILAGFVIESQERLRAGIAGRVHRQGINAVDVEAS